jgi:hypothetical protein
VASHASQGSLRTLLLLLVAACGIVLASAPVLLHFGREVHERRVVSLAERDVLERDLYSFSSSVGSSPDQLARELESWLGTAPDRRPEPGRSLARDGVRAREPRLPTHLQNEPDASGEVLATGGGAMVDPAMIPAALTWIPGRVEPLVPTHGLVT